MEQRIWTCRDITFVILISGMPPGPSAGAGHFPTSSLNHHDASGEGVFSSFHVLTISASVLCVVEWGSNLVLVYSSEKDLSSCAHLRNSLAQN